ncbi:MAG: hypothetical protein ACRDSZ_16815, partial [Pseudonocardiaceae bacterium]
RAALHGHAALSAITKGEPDAAETPAAGGGAGPRPSLQSRTQRPSSTTAAPGRSLSVKLRLLS